ncbi:MAG: MCE family protein [Muribaculaceae bacterium]|jgi:phospholipid/cholesterol/gamma-HCH transport system substrate-binding protein|nr:MCE family protein [Muribaculaceae bacterium]
MKKFFSREIIIGLSVLISLLVLFFGIDYLKGINVFKAANYYYASFTNVAGLAQSAPVTVNGFKVGLVREIQYEYDNPGHVRVELSLDRQLRIPKGTQAVIATDMLGTASIELKMAAHPDYHNVGDVLEGVEGSGLMDKVSTELMPTIMSIAPHIDSLVVSLNTIAGDPALLNAVRRLDAIMANLETSTNMLNKSMATVPALVTHANGTMANVEQLSANLTQVSAALAVISEDLKTMPLDSTMRNINNITANLDLATKQLNSTNSSLGLLLNDPQLYHNINNSAAHIDSILIDLKRQPKRYIPAIKIF